MLGSLNYLSNGVVNFSSYVVSLYDAMNRARIAPQKKTKLTKEELQDFETVKLACKNCHALYLPNRYIQVL